MMDGARPLFTGVFQRRVPLVCSDGEGTPRKCGDMAETEQTTPSLRGCLYPSWPLGLSEA